MLLGRRGIRIQSSCICKHFVWTPSWTLKKNKKKNALPNSTVPKIFRHVSSFPAVWVSEPPQEKHRSHWILCLSSGWDCSFRRRFVELRVSGREVSTGSVLNPVWWGHCDVTKGNTEYLSFEIQTYPNLLMWNEFTGAYLNSPHRTQTDLQDEGLLGSC